MKSWTKPNYKIQEFPQSRVATIDVGKIGKQKNHIAGIVEFDVTESRLKIREYNRNHDKNISLTAWLISVISTTIKKHETSASFLAGKNRLIIFEDINVSLIVEKEMNGNKVPIPLVIEKAHEISIERITQQIAQSKNTELSEGDIVLQRKTKRMERLYYRLPGFLRMYVWKYLLKHPKLAYSKMGNVAITAVGMMGKINGWFIPTSIHPVCFGIGSVIKKPVVVDDKIAIREMLNMAVLIDHDVMDGANMARFMKELSRNIESGLNL